MGLSHVVPELLKKAFFSEDKTLDVFSSNHKRTFCYIDDAIEMMRFLAETENSIGQVFNIGNESPEISIEELAQSIIKMTGKNLKINRQPATAGSPTRRCPDMSKTIEVTGYKPKIDIITGLQKTFEWYKVNVFENEGLSAI
jgi:nucleoside-diphosphate-sugar epimerase